MSGNLARLGFTGSNLPDWHPEGACNGRTDLDWYGETPEEIAAVKAVCGGCSIQVTCLQDAIDRREAWGIWGGLDEKERAEYAKKLGAELPTIVRHGERARYVGTKNVPGCRCPLCTRANSDDEHRRRLLRVERKRNGWVPPTKPCEGCGQQFTGRTERQRFCRPECKTLWEKRQAEIRRQERLARRCARCGGSMALERQRYCSDECAKPKATDGAARANCQRLVTAA